MLTEEPIFFIQFYIRGLIQKFALSFLTGSPAVKSECSSKWLNNVSEVMEKLNNWVFSSYRSATSSPAPGPQITDRQAGRLSVYIWNSQLNFCLWQQQ